MKNKTFGTLFVVAGLAALGAASGCGKAPTPDASASAAPGATTTGTTPPTTTTTNGPPNYSFHYQMTGSGSASQVGGGVLRVATDSSLVVTITAGDTLPLLGTGFTVGFNCERFDVKVGNITQSAFVMRQGYSDVPLTRGWMSYDPCQGATTSWTYDFSAALAPGHNNVNIQISGAQYDNCRLFGDVYDGGCSMSTVYSTHAVDGYAQIFTN